MIRARDVLSHVARAADMTVEDLTGPSRRRTYAHARFVVVWLIRQKCPHMSYPAIGRLLGNRDHTTALHADRSAPKAMAENPRLQKIATDAMAHFSTSQIESLNHAIAEVSAELDALTSEREACLNSETAALFGAAA